MVKFLAFNTKREAEDYSRAAYQREYPNLPKDVETELMWDVLENDETKKASVKVPDDPTNTGKLDPADRLRLKNVDDAERDKEVTLRPPGWDTAAVASEGDGEIGGGGSGGAQGKGNPNP